MPYSTGLHLERPRESPLTARVILFVIEVVANSTGYGDPKGPLTFRGWSIPKLPLRRALIWATQSLLTQHFWSPKSVPAGTWIPLLPLTPGRKSMDR